MIVALVDLGWSVCLVTTQPIGSDQDPRPLQRMGVGVFHGDPQTVGSLIKARNFDLAFCAFWPTAELYMPMIRQLSPSTRIVVDTVDLHFVRHARTILGSKAQTGQLDAAFGDQMVGELNVYSAADAVVTVSQKEADLINDWTGQPRLSHVVPDSESVTGRGVRFARRRGILFVGSFRHAPNVEAIGYLCKEILPLVDARLRAEHPMYIVGDSLDDSIARLTNGLANVKVVGWVPSLVPYFESARLSVLPLLSGAGTKRKLIQSALLGTPVVATPIGVEGFPLTPGRDVLVATDPEAFARDTERLLTDHKLWHRLATNARQRIEAAHSPDTATEALVAVIEEVMAKPPRPPMLAAATPELHHERLLYQYQRALAVREAVATHAIAATSSTDDGDRDASGLSVQPGASRVFAGTEDDIDQRVRLIAFYLPQFHPIPENDLWWGDGFTEWTNVAKARPLFDGHTQPKLPGELGLYDLRDERVRQAQADLAASHGIFGFCYYHYWFGSKRLLERPFEDVLRLGRPDFPFTLCWANEPWSRRWDGSDHEVLQPQMYSDEDDLQHIRALLPALADRRAITAAGKPMLLIYQARDLPDPARTAELWREEAVKAGLSGLYLLAIETGWDSGWDATRVGFDAKVLFQPQFTDLLNTPELAVRKPGTLKVHDYQRAWPLLARPEPVPYRRFATVFPSWDNTPRRGPNGVVVDGSTPEAYEAWLRQAIEEAHAHPVGERFVFINAWNEWGEGCYLEPDRENGRAFLEATRRAVGGDTVAKARYSDAERAGDDRSGIDATLSTGLSRR